MPLKNRWIFWVLAIVTAVDLYFVQTESAYRMLSKPMLMPLLILAYMMAQDNKSPFARLMIAALLFSWMGDILLMFDGSLFFMAGLGSFLVAHLLYIIYFSRIRSDRPSFLKKRPLMLLVIVAYTIELLYVLWPGLGDLKIPVVVYASVISTMLAAAAWQYNKLPNHTAWLFITGAFLFVLSDSALAINKFGEPFTGGGIFVMFTYVAAQTLLVLGSLSHLRGVQNSVQAASA
jgi:uncharacterized membrane protein YhhN